MKRMMFGKATESIDDNFSKLIQRKEIERKGYDMDVSIDRFEFPVELIRWLLDTDHHLGFR